MPERRDMIVIAATIIAETAWLYPAFGMLGHGLSLDGSPLPLALVMAVIAAGVVIRRIVAANVSDPARRAPYLAASGLGVVYLAMSVAAADGGLDLIWGPRLLGGGFSGNVALGLIIGTAATGILWYRGVRIGIESGHRYQLLQTFRIGIIALAVAILAEQAFDIEVSATTMLVPFFGVSLSGLAFARLPPGGTWTRIVGLAVAVVLGGGFVIGLIGAVVGGRGLGLLAAGWSHLAAAIMWLLSVLLVPVLEVIFAFFAWLIGDIPNQNRDFNALRPDGIRWWENIDVGQMPPFAELILQVVKYPVLFLFIYLLYRLFLWAYQAHARRALVVVAADRESIRGGADSTADLIKLALGLLPSWMLRQAPTAGLRFPDDIPGISEVYALYFDMLTAAHGLGHEFQPSATPRERRPDIEKTLPGAPVAGITRCFNAACYGKLPTDRETVDQLRRELDGALGAG